MKQENTDKNNKYELNKKIGWSYRYSEKIHKSCHSHCDTNCIEGTFIKKVLREIVGVKLENILNYDNTSRVTNRFANVLV